MFWFNHYRQGAYNLSFAKVNYNFSKAQIIRSLMMVIKPKHVGAVLM
jgi:hypothetical protein